MTMRPPAIRIGHRLAAVLLPLTFGSGCWEVIPYKPDMAQSTSAPEHDGRELGASHNTSSSPSRNGKPDGEAGNKARDSGAPSDLSGADHVVPVDVTGTASDDGVDGDGIAGNETVGDDLPESSATDSRTRWLAWKLGSRWSLGAAYFARDVSANRYRPICDEAAATAHGLGVELPSLLPELEATDPKVPSVVAYLMEDKGPELADHLDRRFDQAHAKLFELATGSHVLLLIYSPRHRGIQPQLDQVEQSAHASGLPEPIWGPLVELLRKRAPYPEVKKKVFRLHERVDEYFSQLQ